MIHWPIRSVFSRVSGFPPSSSGGMMSSCPVGSMRRWYSELSSGAPASKILPSLPPLVKASGDVEPQLALLLLGPVALVAILREDRLDLLDEVDLRRVRRCATPRGATSHADANTAGNESNSFFMVIRRYLTGFRQARLL